MPPAVRPSFAAGRGPGIGAPIQGFYAPKAPAIGTSADQNIGRQQQQDVGPTPGSREKAFAAQRLGPSVWLTVLAQDDHDPNHRDKSQRQDNHDPAPRSTLLRHDY